MTISEHIQTLRDEQKRLQLALSDIHRQKTDLQARYNETVHRINAIDASLRELREVETGGRRDAAT